MEEDIMANAHITRPRLIVVSNRLPFNVTVEEGTLRYRESTGGLVTSLSSYIEALGKSSESLVDHLWVGWPGSTVEGPLQETLREEAVRTFRSCPVFLSQEEMDQFYFGFCNKTIWPLFHYFPSFTVYDEKSWEQYKHVNAMFCETLANIITQDDVVWVQDYHLMLLPHLLKTIAPKVPVGFFLHIPFPSFEVFRLLPVKWRREILEGLLGADLIGFHTYEYTQHFLQSVLRILGHDHNMGQIVTPDRVVKVETFPLGIEYDKFAQAVHDPEVQREREALKEMLPNVKVILSVDRLDYTKGILNRLQGFEILLETSPEFIGHVVLIMVVVPSRIGVEEYALMKKQIEEAVGNINGKFGRIGWTPVIYQYRHVPFLPLVALYSVSDICLVTPLRDGMNLVAKEYAASRINGSGVLILSEMAGAAKELAEAIVINPNNRGEIAEAMKEALQIPLAEQKRKNQIIQTRLRRYTVHRWAEDFIQHLRSRREVQDRFGAKILSPTAKRKIVEQFGSSSQRILFLDYDGTLVPLARYPDLARPDASVLTLLESLSADPRNTVVIISGRDQTTMQSWFGRLAVGMVAEHGVWFKWSGEDWKMPKQFTKDWKVSLRPILDQYADRVPGSFVEEKGNSLVWHYRNADPNQGRAIAAEVTDNLVNFTANVDVRVLKGSKVVEIRNAGIDKGRAALEWLSRAFYDFILAVGDDWTDEDLFNALPESAFSIRVGITTTHARHNLRNSAEVTKLLESLLQLQRNEEGMRIRVSAEKDV